MFGDLDWRMRLAGGLIMVVGALFAGKVGFDLRDAGEAYSHIWVLALLCLWGGSDWILKSFK